MPDIGARLQKPKGLAKKPGGLVLWSEGFTPGKEAWPGGLAEGHRDMTSFMHDDASW